MITIISLILILTFLIWLVNKKLPFNMCPICAGVSLTWLWLIFGMFLGKLEFSEYQLPTALLLGGTVVGLMSKLEVSIKRKFLLIWKTLFVLLGFTTAYGLLSFDWKVFTVGLFTTIIITFVLKKYKKKKNEDNTELEELEEKMKNCC